jgi:hypothetical protein
MSIGTLSLSRHDTPNDDRSVATNDSGAIMVIGVFMAMLVTGFLYYIVGIGNTIIYRERLQDAADAIAFSGAVVHARGMNIIAMINIVLLVLMTIFVAMRLIERAVFAMVIVCGTVLAVVCGPAVPPLEAADRILVRIIDAYSRGVLQPALQLGHTAQEQIRNNFPRLAHARAVLTGTSGIYSPPSSFGALLPSPLLSRERPLPVRPIPLDQERNPPGLCTRAIRNVSAALTFPLSATFLAPLRALITQGISRVLGALRSILELCPPDRPSWRNYDMDPGSGDCSDGLPGQQCEYSQLRGVSVAGSTPFSRNERGVNVASLGRAAGGGGLAAFEPFTRIGLAQAEYYYDGNEDYDEWAYHMYWRARFRRVRLGSAITSIPGVSAATGIIDRIIVH